MAIQVIDRRSATSAMFVAPVVKVSNIPTKQEVVMSKVNAIVVKQITPVVEQQFNPKVEEVKMKTQKMFTLEEVNKMVKAAVDLALGSRKPQVMRVNAETVQPVEEVKVKADMHEAGRKAYRTRIFAQAQKTCKEVVQQYQPGVVFEVTMDSGLPTAKVLKMKYDSKDGRLHSFRAKVETGKPGSSAYKVRYEKISYQF